MTENQIQTGLSRRDSMWLDLGLKEAVRVPFLVFPALHSILSYAVSCLRLPVVVRPLRLAVQPHPGRL